MNNNPEESPEKKRHKSAGSNQPSAGSNQPSASSSNQPSAGDPTYTNGNPFLTPRPPQKPTIEEQYKKVQQRHGVGFPKPADQYREEYYATTQPSTTVYAPYVEQELSFKNFMADFMNSLSGR